MSVRLKTALALAATTGLCVAAISIALHIQLQRSYSLIERQQAQQQIERCLATLHSELHHLGLIVGDWAIWDDTYQFMADQNLEYVNSNLIATSLAHSHIDGVYYFNNARKLVQWRQLTPDEAGFDSHPRAEGVKL